MSDPFDLSQLQQPLNLPFPATTKQAAGNINGVQTEVVYIEFADKILVTISQKGRLAHWLHVPLENKNPGTEGFHMIPDSSEDSLLPINNLTATSVLGGRVPGQETIGQLYARQIASAIVTKSPDENRLLIVGLGLDTAEADRDVFFGIIELVLQCV
ncbi:uncharacterized protein ASPGLDRAFT_131760 [Aspergillus glaucus CBS 516.65]|uniref:Uncharacterized protein n=1 Tax=Aspergillus glaucus CBS 516.65 TaxID=1160497 RepID=A0A1L9VDE8_ASPGL|nr:hypothetical protein ASPGLDRAFT_131760 [Aspergillus glaucus CBS 516.65]OJJ81903.1 hypothetical protein ASPGLDRAFT_131760 [Aspergillus glaucus CBS 516.65]